MEDRQDQHTSPDKQTNALEQVSSIYGPVRSWRVGWSLGVDLICVNSVCSFNCTYCQLGNIQVRTNERRLFVPTEKVMRDLEESDWRKADIITFSGSGEPALALNLGESIEQIRHRTGKPVLILTNGTLLHLPEVRSELCAADRVYLKLDACSDSVLQRVNRPVEGVTLEGIVEAGSRFREEFKGYLGIQMMFVHSNEKELDAFAAMLHRLKPDEVQVNTPTRPYPDSWYLASRGSHEGVDYPARPIKPLSVARLDSIVEELRRRTTGVNIICVAKSSRLTAENA
ncbi:MAG: radical SAM protein [Acidobacteriota bacterium]|nr:MAG: radical SAM protein [Acidobacteriota bacterium]